MWTSIIIHNATAAIPYKVPLARRLFPAGVVSALRFITRILILGNILATLNPLPEAGPMGDK